MKVNIFFLVPEVGLEGKIMVESAAPDTHTVREHYIKRIEK